MKIIIAVLALTSASVASAQSICTRDYLGNLHCTQVYNPYASSYQPQQPVNQQPVYVIQPQNPGMVNYQQGQQQLNAQLCAISHLPQYCGR